MPWQMDRELEPRTSVDVTFAVLQNAVGCLSIVAFIHEPPVPIQSKGPILFSCNFMNSFDHMYTSAHMNIPKMRKLFHSMDEG